MREKNTFKTLTTLNVGGPIASLVVCETEAELLNTLSHETKDFFILGGGSNVLAPDEGYRGTVYMPRFKAVSFIERGDEVFVTIEAGASWDEVVKETVDRGLWGFENLSAIPGSMGGAVFQNIGAYGAALSKTVVSVRAFDVREKKIRTFSHDECAFGYRTSIFKQHAPRYVILSATCKLQKNSMPNVAYADLVQQFAHDPSPRLSSIRAAVCAIRKKKFPDLNEYGTAGSFFLNPIISDTEVEHFKKQYPDMPLFSLPEGGTKVPLAWILDHVIHAKEMRVGGAFVWQAQALVLATEKNATARDVYSLYKKIQEKVFEKTNLTIFPEVRVL